MADAFSDDAFLGGRLSILQPKTGHRSGIEAVLIAAAAPLEPGETVADIGAGVGVAGLCALSRVADTKALLLEADPQSVELARKNAGRNGMAERVTVHTIDVAARGAADRAGLTGTADHALANPPFYDPAANRISPSKAQAHAAPAHAAPADLLDGWLRFAAAVLRPGGSLTLVHRADALGLVLQATGRRFGGLAVLPVHPRRDAPATRVIVRGHKGSRAPLNLLPDLVLHDEAGHGFRPEIEAVLRFGAALRMGD